MDEAPPCVYLPEEHYLVTGVHESNVPIVSEAQDPQQWMSEHWLAALPLVGPGTDRQSLTSIGFDFSVTKSN